MKKIKKLAISSLFYPLLVTANIQPVVGLSIGANQASVFQNTIIDTIAPLQNTYTGLSNHNTQVVGGVFLGGETELSSQWRWQYGVQYLATDPFNVSGNVFQFSDPLYNNLNYNYYIQNYRVLAETKLFANFTTRWHPYAIAAIGAGINKTYNYYEIGKTSADVPMTVPFMNKTATGLAYSLGLGLDMDLSNQVRIGVNYRWSDLGKASLGTTPLQDSTTTIHYSNFRANELLVEISYVV